MPDIKMNWDETIRGDLSAGTFTPFLGAGAASLRSYDDLNVEKEPWNKVKTTLGKIYARVPVESRTFLQSFVKQRLRLSNEQLKELLPDQDKDAVPLKADEVLDLIDLQVALVDTLRLLTKLFGGEFIEQVPSLRELPDCAVTFSFGSGDVKTAWVELYKAIAIAKKLRDKARDPRFRGADSEWQGNLWL